MKQNPQQPTLQINHVVRPFGKILILHLLEEMDILTENLLHGTLGHEPIPRDGAADFVQQPLVVEHQQMSVENRGIFLAQFLGDRFPAVTYFVIRDPQRFLETHQFLGNLLFRTVYSRDLEPAAAENQSFSDGDSGGNRDSVQSYHYKYYRFVRQRNR